MSRRGENIYKRKDGRWEGRIKRGEPFSDKYRYQSVYGKTYKEVKLKMDAVKTQNIVENDFTMADAANKWLNAQRNNWKPGTYSTYQQVLNKYIIPYMGNMQISKINSQILDEFVFFINNMQTGSKLSNNYLFQLCGTIRRIVIYMNQKYDCAIPVPANPIVKGHMQQVILPSERTLFILEKYLYEHCNTDTCLGILIAFHTGIRIGELSALMWKDIDLRDEIIYIRRNILREKEESNTTQIIEQTPKTSDSVRIIPIPPKIIPYLSKYKKDDSDYIISGVKNPWAEPRTIQYRFKKILEQCEIEYFNFHMLRHAFATRCVAMGLDIKSLSEILGHSNIQITLNLYVHSSVQQKKQLMKQYDAFFQEVFF